jgi:TonB family protein
LTLGPSGRIVSHAITRSSGSVALDREVDAMMAEVQAPPPPGGIFRAGLTIHFGLE